MAFPPPETVATGAIGAAAPFSVIMAKSFGAAGAIVFDFLNCRYAQTPATPVESSELPLAAVHALAVVRETEEEERE